MPKQSGIYQIKGKFENRSYYKPKNMSTGIFRSINQQMSERVKTEPNFANTRANAGEFGCATSFANQIANYLATLAPVTNLAKKRGDIAHSALGMIRQDNTHIFGQRSLRVNGWQDTMMTMLNQMPRVLFDANYLSGMSFYSFREYSAGTTQYKVHVHIPNDSALENRLAEWGANHVAFRVFVCRWEAGYYSTLLGKYYPAQLITEQIAYIESQSLPRNDDYATTITLDGSYPANWFMKILVVATPIRDINDDEFPLEHLRSFKIFDLPTNETYIESVMYKGITYNQGARSFVLDVANNPNIIVNLHVLSGTTIDSATAKINGIDCTATKLSATQFRLQMPATLDGRTMNVLVLTSNGTTYRFETA